LLSSPAHEADALMLTCPSCASENSDSQKFCGACGARLTVPASGHTLSSPAASYTPPHLAEKILASRFALEGYDLRGPRVSDVASRP
jgi:hypothetical protein